jgi:hypothetical protein
MSVLLSWHEKVGSTSLFSTYENRAHQNFCPGATLNGTEKPINHADTIAACRDSRPGLGCEGYDRPTHGLNTSRRRVADERFNASGYEQSLVLRTGHNDGTTVQKAGLNGISSYVHPLILASVTTTAQAACTRNELFF